MSDAVDIQKILSNVKDETAPQTESPELAYLTRLGLLEKAWDGKEKYRFFLTESGKEILADE